MKPDRATRLERIRTAARLSVPMRALLSSVQHGPRTWADLSRNIGARQGTFIALLRKGLITTRDLRDGPFLNSPLRTFIDATPIGREVHRAGQQQPWSNTR
ncbi:hypothetical protein CA234_02960 [Sphingomonas sp. ABOLE]|uniref:hypothetical protein n=1 Tax=Sphingomonas sp. ABOLE TaxID=1985878 RepID=UPI000F7D81F9|nr:hypothetical protein [Sphingomonas sp. ABOLE]RSV44391.1 hypothetical protein CA234_02960 [Sphingomonas sp. ABOLE]